MKNVEMDMQTAVERAIYWPKNADGSPRFNSYGIIADLVDIDICNRAFALWSSIDDLNRFVFDINQAIKASRS